MAAAVETGSTLPGGVRVGRLVGEGVFAQVFDGWLPSGDRVAVKVLRRRDKQAQRRFNREIQVQRALPPSPHVVGYRAHGTTEDGRPWLAMEYVDGFTLSKVFDQGRPMTPSQACTLMLQLCDSFGGLHRLGLAHRDIKPANVMITFKGRIVKLMDFGLVRDAQGLLRLFETEDILEGREFADDIDHGMLAGTPEYMAPEQITDPSLPEGAAGRTDTTADVYSLGVIFYQLLAAKKPFPFVVTATTEREYQKEVMSYLRSRLWTDDSALMPIPGLSEALWSVVAKALRREPKLRQGDATALHADIKRFVETGQGVPKDIDESRTLAVDTAGLESLIEGEPSRVMPKRSEERTMLESAPRRRVSPVAWAALAAALAGVGAAALLRIAGIL